MKVKELIVKLLDYNLDASIEVIVDYHPKDFKILFGGTDGGKKKDCDIVSFCTDKDCEDH